MVNFGVIGCGYWGANLVRNIAENQNANLVWVSDLRKEQLSLVGRRFPSVKRTLDYREILADPKIDIVAIATPVRSHFDLGMEALAAGKHVLIEKPIADSSERAKRLIDEGARRGKMLFVDHTFLFTGAVRKIGELVSSNRLGTLYYYDLERVNLGLFQHDVNVIWDLAVHDLSILDFICRESPVAVSATGVAHVKGHPEDVAYITVHFNSTFIAHINVNWLAPVKLRRTLIGGEDRMLVYDDLLPDEKIKIYEKGIRVTNDPDQILQMLVGYRTGDMTVPKLDPAEALSTEIKHIVDCVGGKEKPIADGQSGLRIVRLLEAASKSMEQRGHPVEVDHDQDG